MTLFERVKKGDLKGVENLLKNNDTPEVDLRAVLLAWGKDGSKIKEQLKILSLLNLHGYDLKTKTDNGNSLLHYTAATDFTGKLVKYFLTLPLDINAVNIEMRTPLHIACDMGNLNGVEVLLKANASVNVEDAAKITPMGVVLSNLLSLPYLEEKEVFIKIACLLLKWGAGDVVRGYTGNFSVKDVAENLGLLELILALKKD